MTNDDDARSLLRRLRAAGLEVEADGDALRIRGPRGDVRDGEALLRAARDAKPALLAALREERAAAAPPDPPPADVRQGDLRVGIPADEPATARQLERLRELAEHPDILTDRAREDVERAVDGGLSELGAWGLLGELGRRVAERRARDGGRPKRCPTCPLRLAWEDEEDGEPRRVGATSECCGRCHRHAREVGELWVKS